MRDRDELWDAMILALGLDSAGMTRSERGRINRALMELREVKATPEQVTARAREYVKRWPMVSLTATALTAHWSSLGPSRKALTIAEGVLQNMLAEHGRGLVSKRVDAQRYIEGKLTKEERNEPSIVALMEKFAWMPRLTG